MKNLRVESGTISTLISIALLALFLPFVGCKKDPPPSDGPAPSVDLEKIRRTPDLASPGQPDTGAAPIDRKRPLPKPEPAAEEDKVSILAEEMLDYMESKFSKDTIFSSRYREGFDRRIRDSKHFISLIREIYTASKYTPLFFLYEDKIPSLNGEGSKLQELLLQVQSHGLDPKRYRTQRLQDLLTSLETVRRDYVQARTALENPKAQKLWSLVEKHRTLPGEKALKAELAQMGLEDDDSVLIRDLAQYYPNLLQSKKKLNAVVQEIDILLLHGFFQFALDFKYIYRAHPFRVTPEISLSHVKFRDKLREEFQTAEPHYAAHLEQLIPINPTYHRLRAGLAYYVNLRDQGNIDKITVKKNLKKGRSGVEVKKLSQRLYYEGYLEENQISDKFGKQMYAAVKRYQHMHQLRENGRTDRATRSSMNVPMARRVKQIRLALQRWRESDISRDRLDYYARVNIPQFELEIYEKNKKVRTHRIVVGNTKKETSLERRQRGMFNLTPLLSKKITTVVLNPLWFPPPRLQKELLEELEKEPDFFEKHNYGIRMGSDGSEVIFQKAGPGNALGRVKFLFPNEHSVYLHDTNAKALFNRPIRAYSHGCMRVEKPLDLARYLLDHINGMPKRKIQKILDKEKEHYIKLVEPVPIYIEYNAIGANDENRIYFYADIYKYDRAYWEGQLPVQNTEDLTSQEVKKLSGASDDSATDEEDDNVFPGT